MKISIVVPVYNVENYIEKCIKSILNQTLEDFECLLVDDGSLDKSIDNALRVVGNDKRFKVLKKSNGGLSDARNFGLKEAKGEYVLFLDSDDSIEANTLELSYNMAKKHDSDITCFDIAYVYEGGRVEVEKCGVEEVSNYRDNKELIYINKSACNKLYRREFLKDKSFIKGIWYEDLAVLPVWMAQANNVSYVDKALYLYLQREGSISHSADPRIFDIYYSLGNVKKGLGCSADDIIRLYYENCAVMTTLRIRDIENQEMRRSFYKKHIDLLNEECPNWFNYSMKNADSLKRKLVYLLLKLKLVNLLDTVY